MKNGLADTIEFALGLRVVTRDNPPLIRTVCERRRALRSASGPISSR
jgi:hypothetical protein